MQRYLICFPQGGVNDMFCRIQYCIQYCMSEQRTLVIDTNKNWFRDDWRHYFSIPLPIIYQGDSVELIRELLTNQDCYPALNLSYDELEHAKWIKPGHMEMNGKVVSTSLSHSYQHQVVIYADCGSSPHINPLLQAVIFSSWLKDEFKKRRSSLPDQYVAVHIRNTDYQSDVDGFLEKYHSIFSTYPLFLASDHLSTINRMKAMYPKVFTFSSIPSVPELLEFLLHRSDF